MLDVFGGTVVLAASLCLASAAQADGPTTGPILYVKVGGTASTRATGLSSTTPFGSIQTAVTKAVAGDIIQISAGTYKGNVAISGKTNITLKAETITNKPVVESSDTEQYKVIDVQGSNQITINGLEIDGLNGTTANRKERNGIQITVAGSGSTAVPSRNILIQNCTVHDVGGGGIITDDDSTHTRGCDYIHIYDNIVYRTNSTGSYSSSAISLLADQNSNKDDTAFHDRVERNRVFSNKSNSGVVTNDGNGIIVDSNVTTASPNQPAQVLVANNLVYDNSGRGIHIFRSSNVTVLNNTLYKNNTGTISSKAELSAGGNAGELYSNILFSNNVVQGNGTDDNGTGSAPAFRAGNTFTSVSFKNNTYKNTQYPDGTTQATIVGSTTIHSVAANGPLFANPGTSITANFMLVSQTGSNTALNKGSNVRGEFAWDSFNGVTRYNGTSVVAPGGVDRGAYEQ